MTLERRWSGPGRALEFHLDLFGQVVAQTDWIRDHHGKTFMIEDLPDRIRQRTRLMIAHHPFNRGRGERHEPFNTEEAQQIINAAVAMVTRERQTLDEAETHYVSHSVMASITAAAESAEPEPLFPTDLPSQSGLIVFESPLLIPDVGQPGILIPARAVSWRVGDGVGWIDESGDETMRPGISYMVYQHVDDLPFMTEVNDEPTTILSERATTTAQKLGTWVTDISGWTFGNKWTVSPDADWTVWAAGTVVEGVAYFRRWLLAYFRWTWTRIIVPTRYEPNRAQNRRIDRARFDLIDGYVKVMKLRRTVDREARGETSSDEYATDHQWIVRGHWRRQWYRSLGPARIDGAFNEESHRLVWIEPHIAGNPDGPLVVGYDVTAAVR